MGVSKRQTFGPQSQVCIYRQLPMFGFTTRYLMESKIVNACMIFYCLYISCTLIGRVNIYNIIII